MSEQEIEVQESGLAALAQMTGAQVLATIENPYEDQFDELAKASWLPRIQLEGSNSNLVKLDKIPKGSYALHTGKDKFTELGKNVECLVLTFRPKATDLSDVKKILTSYNPKSPLYMKIKEDAESKDKEVKKSKMYGMEFLLYLPEGPDGKKYATLHMGNATSRFEAGNFRPLMKKPARLGVETINNGQYIWEAIRVFSLTRDIVPDDLNEMALIVSNFLKPPADSVEVSQEESTGETRG